MSTKNTAAACARLRSRVLRAIRAVLEEAGFIELSTPVLRASDCGFRPRPTVNFWETRYLRESIGPALRFNLQHLERVYEIGPCFRFEDTDETHAPEFYMMDLYAANEGLGFVKSLAQEILCQTYQEKLQEYSVGDHLANELDVDLSSSDPEAIRLKLINRLRMRSDTTIYDAFEAFFDRELIEVSRGRAIMYVDLPLGTEVCARLRPGTTALLNRFEVFVDEVEVMHGYEDETDFARFREAAAEIGFLTSEQERIIKLREKDILPPSSGFAIGLERLCMACLKGSQLSDFRCSVDY